MKKIKKVHFSEGSIGKSGSGDNCVLEEPSQVELLLEQIADIAELIDGLGLRLETKNQDLAIIAKGQRINNLNKTINAKGQHINNLNKAINAKDQYINNLNKTINAKGQHINNLNKAIAAKDQHSANLEGFIRNLTREIVNIKKYSVFYNLLLRFRRELSNFFVKIQK
jgi:chromosome segregation ATPase